MCFTLISFFLSHTKHSLHCHSRTFSYPAQRFSKVLSPRNKRATKVVLVDEIVLICKSNSFTLVDVIDPNGFKNLGLDKMIDTSTDHYGDRNDALDFLDERRVWHARNASLRWVRDNETTCTSLFDDLGMFGDIGSILLFSFSLLFSFFVALYQLRSLALFNSSIAQLLFFFFRVLKISITLSLEN